MVTGASRNLMQVVKTWWATKNINPIKLMSQNKVNITTIKLMSQNKVNITPHQTDEPKQGKYQPPSN